MRAKRVAANFRSWFDLKAETESAFHSVAGLKISEAAVLINVDSKGNSVRLQDLIGTSNDGAGNGFPPHIIAAASSLQETTADRLIDLRFTLAAEPEVRFQSEIDWQYDPTPDPARRWAKALHRHHWLVYLAKAYEKTADEKYAKAAGELLLHWIEHNPPPRAKDEKNVAWTLMGAGIRAMIWPDAVQFFSRCAFFREEVAPRLLLSLHDHATFLARYQTHLNHLLRESNGLLHIALRFSAFREAPRWRQIAIDRLSQEIDTQIQDDGSHIELSPAYQWLVVEELESTRRLCDIGEEHPELVRLKRKVVAGLSRLYDYLGAIATPAGSWPQIKEGFYPPQEGLRAELLKTALQTGNTELEWIATNGAKGQPPLETNRFFAEAGVAVFRSNWSSKAHYLIFQNGAFGGPHGHEDALAFELWAAGEAFLVDPGTSSYNIKDPFRHYFTSSNAHNTITVDQMSQVRRWSRKNWWNRPGENPVKFGDNGTDLSWVSGSYSGRYAPYKSIRGRYGRATRGITHRRQVVFVRNSYWLLIDDLTAAKASTFQRLFQGARDTEVTTTIRGVRLSKTSNPQELHIIAHAPTSVSVATGETSPIAGWVCDGTRNARYPAPQISFQSAPCKKTRLITLIMPTFKKQPTPKLEAYSCNSLHISYQKDDREHTDVVRLDSTGAPLSMDDF